MYRSEFEAYPFLGEADGDLRCDFEILTDEIASMIGLLRSTVRDGKLCGELVFVCELVYHINPSLRTAVSVTRDELAELERIVAALKSETEGRRRPFVLPVGCRGAALSHVIRSRCKSAARLLYRHTHRGNKVDAIVLDFVNLLSGYFFFLALKLNALEGVGEIAFESRNYGNRPGAPKPSGGFGDGL